MAEVGRGQCLIREPKHSKELRKSDHKLCCGHQVLQDQKGLVASCWRRVVKVTELLHSSHATWS